MSAPLPSFAMLGPLRIRDFRLLWTAMTVSLLGDGIFYLAIAWQVYELSDAPTALSMVGLAMSVSQVVFLLLGGVASDRFDRRRVMLAADLVLHLLHIGFDDDGLGKGSGRSIEGLSAWSWQEEGSLTTPVRWY